MTSLLILIPFVVTFASGRPGSYNYLVPIPASASAPSLFNLQALSAPQAYNIQPTPTPSVINLPSPSIAPSLLVENVLGAGQYGSAPVNVQSLGPQFVSGIPLSVGLLQNQIPFFAQPEVNLGAPLLPTSVPQLSDKPPQFSPSQVSVPLSGLNSASASLQGPLIDQNKGIIVHKHFYVYVAPEDPEERAPPRQIVLPPPRKNYRIIFIKAPTPPALKVNLVPPQVQDEDKTVVYVLVKKQEEQPEVKIEAPSPVTPSKPEVYFIRYKAQQGGSDPTPQLPSDHLPVENRNGDVPVIEDDATLNDATVPTVRIGDTGLHTSVPTVRIGDTGLHTSVPSVRIGDTGLHTSDPTVRIGDTDLHTSDPTVRIGDTGLHASVPTVRIGDTSLHTSDPTVRIGDTDLHTSDPTVRIGDTGLHASVPSVRIGDTGLHTSDPTVRIGDTDLHTSDPTVRIGDTDLHTSDPTVRIGDTGLHTSDPTVRIGDTGLHTNVDLNLNKASLDGGSALSLAVSDTPEDNQDLSTSSPQYGPPAPE